jgi:hypothetical protein
LSFSKLGCVAPRIQRLIVDCSTPTALAMSRWSMPAQAALMASWIGD